MAQRSSNDGRYTPTQAAHILRLSPTRVRQLLQSGELEGNRDAAGHWTIPAHVVHERLERLRRESFLEAVGYDPSSGPEMRDLVEELREQVAYLRTQLDVRAEEIQRRDVIISQLTQANAALAARVPELEASQEGAEPRSSTGGSQEAAEGPFTEEEEPRRRSWWREFFGI